MNGSAESWQDLDGQLDASAPNGYLCPQQSICMESHNPFNGTLSFDDIGHSLELVFVAMFPSAVSGLMYYIIDSNYIASVFCESLETPGMHSWLAV